MITDMKHLFIKGFWIFLPLFIIANLFLGLPTIVSEKALLVIKPLEYIGFICIAIGLPVYFYIKDNLRVSQSIILIGFMWGLLVLAVILSGIWPYNGLFHDEDITLVFFIKAFVIFFILGFVTISVVCTVAGFVLKKWIINKTAGSGTDNG